MLAAAFLFFLSDPLAIREEKRGLRGEVDANGEAVGRATPIVGGRWSENQGVVVGERPWGRGMIHPESLYLGRLLEAFRQQPVPS